jgi:hypothetical protein
MVLSTQEILYLLGSGISLRIRSYGSSIEDMRKYAKAARESGAHLTIVADLVRSTAGGPQAMTGEIIARIAKAGGGSVVFDLVGRD